MTIRSEGQFNTVVYEDYDLYRGVEGRDVILLHPDDIAAFGLKSGQRVRVRSEAGEMTNILVHEFPEIRAGNAAMYYPEANVLVPRVVDPHSRTPAFKCTLIELEAMPASAQEMLSDSAIHRNGQNGAGELVTVQPSSAAQSTRDQMRAC